MAAQEGHDAESTWANPSLLGAQLRRASEMSLATCCKRDGQQGGFVRRCVWRANLVKLASVPPSPVSNSSLPELPGPGLAAHQHVEGEHSPPKPLDRRCCGREHGHMPEGSPRVRLAIKKPYWLIGATPTLYAAALRRVVYRCRLNKYLQVPARTKTHHPPP